MLICCAAIFGCSRKTAQRTGAEQLKLGRELFAYHCSACHPDGGNLIYPAKTLQRMVMAANGITTPGQIVDRMRNPGPRMKRFNKATISDQDATAIAQYILQAFR